MSNNNPYHELLEISEDRCPPNYYELLGVVYGESDRDRIRLGYQERYARVRSYQVGQAAERALKLLDELTEAYACLSDEPRRLAYDKQFQERQTVVDEASPDDTAVDVEVMDEPADAIASDVAPPVQQRMDTASTPRVPTDTSSQPLATTVTAEAARVQSPERKKAGTRLPRAVATAAPGSEEPILAELVPEPGSATWPTRSLSLPEVIASVSAADRQMCKLLGEENTLLHGFGRVVVFVAVVATLVVGASRVSQWFVSDPREPVSPAVVVNTNTGGDGEVLANGKAETAASNADEDERAAGEDDGTAGPGESVDGEASNASDADDNGDAEDVPEDSKKKGLSALAEILKKEREEKADQDKQKEDGADDAEAASNDKAGEDENTGEEPEEQPREPPKPPLYGLAERIKLPPLPKNGAAGQAVSLGEVHLNERDRVLIDLLGGAIVLGRKGEFKIVEDAAGNRWDIQMVSRSDEVTPVAQLGIHGDDLTFAWLNVTDQKSFDLLRNCMLEIRAGPDRKIVALRPLEQVGPLPAKFDPKKSQLEFVLDNLPPYSKALKFQITGLSEAFPEHAFDPFDTVNEGETIDIHMEGAERTVRALVIRVTFEERRNRAQLIAQAMWRVTKTNMIPITIVEVQQSVEQLNIKKSINETTYEIQRARAFDFTARNRLEFQYQQEMLQLDEQINGAQKLLDVCRAIDAAGRINFRVYLDLGDRHELDLVHGGVAR